MLFQRNGSARFVNPPAAGNVLQLFSPRKYASGQPECGKKLVALWWLE
jgi:hypothetical protein